MKRALIIGASGQDGTLLARFLRQEGYYVVGVSRHGGNGSCNESIALDVRRVQVLRDIVRRTSPAELYYLAAFHRSSQGRPQGRGEASRTFEVNLGSYAAVLEAALRLEPQPRVFYACSSLIFGDAGETPVTEQCLPRPGCLYSISKLAGRMVSEHFRVNERMYVSVGILFNHESALRPEQFLSRRIVEGVRAIQRGDRRHLLVGDMEARCDWGYAGDYVEAMWRMLQLQFSDTYIVTTGPLHSVGDWGRSSCRLAGLDPRAIVEEDPTLLTRKRAVLCGDSTLLRSRTGWQPTTGFEEMVAKMYREEY